MERSAAADRQRLAQLVARVGPVAFASERTMAVAEPLQPLFRDGGLVRGSVVGCQGEAAVSIALATVAAASASGSWLAVVGLPSLGLRAAEEVGIALGRLVMVANPAGLSEAAWANMMSALIDGFDLLVVRDAGSATRHGSARRLQARLQARGAILVVIGDPGPFSCDAVITGRGATWEGLGHGSGRLQRRRMTLSASGRRLPQPRQVEVWLPGAGGGIETSSIEIGSIEIGSIEIGSIEVAEPMAVVTRPSLELERTG